MIDPIPVDEALERIKAEQALLTKRGNGGLALAWFSAHALSKTGGGPRVPLQGVLQEHIDVIASGTTNADKVKPYIQRAYREHQRRILERAIELAQEDFEVRA